MRWASMINVAFIILSVVARSARAVLYHSQCSNHRNRLQYAIDTLKIDGVQVMSAEPRGMMP